MSAGMIGMYPAVEGFEKTGNLPVDHLRYTAAVLRSQAKGSDERADMFKASLASVQTEAANLRKQADELDAAAKVLLG